MQNPHTLRGSLALSLGTLLTTTAIGCTTYYPVPVYSTAPTVASDPCATVCSADPQPAAGGVVVQTNEPSIVVRSPRAPRIVRSTPGNDGPRLSWHRTDPDESLATTRIEGALDEPTTVK